MASKIACLNLTPFGLKIGHKIPPRRSQDAHMTPQDGPRRPKTPPRRLQDASKTTPRRLPDGPRYSQDGSKLPKTPQNASKTPQDAPRRLQDASRPRFWSLQASIFGFFWLLNDIRSWRGGGDAALLRCWIYIYICLCIYIYIYICI